MKAKKKVTHKHTKKKKPPLISKRDLDKLNERILRQQSDIKHYKELGKHGEAIFSAIDNLIASRAIPEYDPKHPLAQFDVDYDPEGVYNRVKWYLLSREQSVLDT